jgi:hypothetical protein
LIGVAVGNGRPLQRTAEVFLHPLHEVAGQLLQVGSFAELGGDDELLIRTRWIIRRNADA